MQGLQKAGFFWGLDHGPRHGNSSKQRLATTSSTRNVPQDMRLFGVEGLGLWGSGFRVEPSAVLKARRQKTRNRVGAHERFRSGSYKPKRLIRRASPSAGSDGCSACAENWAVAWDATPPRKKQPDSEAAASQSHKHV